MNDVNGKYLDNGFDYDTGRRIDYPRCKVCIYAKKVNADVYICTNEVTRKALRKDYGLLLFNAIGFKVFYDYVCDNFYDKRKNVPKRTLIKYKEYYKKYSKYNKPKYPKNETSKKQKIKSC